MWLFSSLKYIDYDIKAYLIECFLICHYSKGGFNKQALDEMPFNEFEIVLQEAKRLNPKEEQEEVK